MPDKPDISEKIKWEHVEPGAKHSGSAHWRIYLSSPARSSKWSIVKKVVGAVVWYCGILGAFVIGATILAISEHSTRSHLVSLLYRSLLSLAASQGGNVWGFISSNVIVPALFVIFFVVLLRESHGEEAMKIHWRRDGIIGLKAILLVIVFYYFPIFLWKGVVRTVYDDHQKLVAHNAALMGENNRISSENTQLRADNDVLRKNQPVPFVEPNNSLRKRTLQLVNDLVRFWSNRQQPPSPQRIQNPSTDQERKQNAAFDKYWNDVANEYNSAHFRERLLGIVREYKDKGVQIGWLEQAIEQPSRQFGALAFGGTGLDDCMRYQTDFCQLQELAYRVDDHDQPIFLGADLKDGSNENIRLPGRTKSKK